MYRTPKHQREVDSLQSAIRGELEQGRRPLFKPPPPRLPRSGDVLDERLAEELEFLRRRISALGGALASDPMLVARYAAQLQDIDLIAQSLGHLATIVGAADKAAAADRVTLAELRGRLRRKPLMSIVPRD